MRVKVVLVVAILALALFVIFIYPHPIKSSTTTQFYVEDKFTQDHEHWIRGYNPDLNPRHEIALLVSDQPEWNSISVDQLYILTYYSEGESAPELVEIVTNK